MNGSLQSVKVHSPHHRPAGPGVTLIDQSSLSDTIENKLGSERVAWYAIPIGGIAKNFHSAEAALACAKNLIQENLDLRVKIVAMDWDHVADVEFMTEIGFWIMGRVNFGL
jgi:hypothetical protein